MLLLLCNLDAIKSLNNCRSTAAIYLFSCWLQNVCYCLLSHCPQFKQLIDGIYHLRGLLCSVHCARYFYVSSRLFCGGPEIKSVIVILEKIGKNICPNNDRSYKNTTFSLISNHKALSLLLSAGVEAVAKRNFTSPSCCLNDRKLLFRFAIKPNGSLYPPIFWWSLNSNEGQYLEFHF